MQGPPVVPRPASEPAISVVVTTHNELRHLRATVAALASTRPESAEIVVVDDQSTDGSTDFLDPPPAPGIRLVRSDARLGITRARNLGASVATGELLVFSDAHVRPHAGWAEPLLAAARRPGVGAVAPRVHSLAAPATAGYGFTWRDPSLRMRWLDGEAGGPPRPVPFLCGCFVAVPRHLFADIGGFDEGLVGWGSEDAELSLRLWGLGYACEVVPAAAVAHLFRRRFPYTVEPVAVMHNTFRLATVHLGAPALARVFAHHRRRPGFAPAYARLAASDVDERRDRVRRERRADAESLLARFGIRALG